MKSNRSRQHTPGWNDYVKPFKDKAYLWHYIWKCNNSPKSGYVADIRRSTRARYHYALRYVRKSKARARISSDKMGIAILNNKPNDLWCEVRRLSGSKSKCTNRIDDVQGSNDICELFANKYNQLYNSVPYNELSMNELLEDINYRISKLSDNQPNNHEITCSDIESAIVHLKTGKSDGSSNFGSEHLIHGNTLLHQYLAILFSCMLSHGFVPHDMLLSTMIPIPKDKRKSINISENYRAIALSSIIGKLFDWVILLKYGDVLMSSDLQFGFKPNHSTTMCTYILQETINYYNRNNNSVYVCFLDASKAFDRVEYVMLFKLLLKRGLCPLIVRMLIYMDCNQRIRVKWSGHTSRSYLVSIGVKQGGVLFPILFAIYIDELLIKLKNSGYGCHIGNNFTGALGYADDIVLACPSKQSLYLMSNICKEFASEFNVIFNMAKTKILYYNKNKIVNNNVIQPNTCSVMDSPILVSEKEKHLGHTLSPYNENINITLSINDLNYRVNSLMCHFSHATYHVRYKLFKSLCMSLYGCVLWDLTSKSVNTFYCAWRKAVRRILNVSQRTHNILLPLICEDNHIEYQMYLRFILFYQAISNSKNALVRFMSQFTLYGSGSPVSRNLNYICNKLNISKCNLSHVYKSQINFPSIHTDNNYQIASNVIDLLYIRENINMFEFTYDECTDMLQYVYMYYASYYNNIVYVLPNGIAPFCR